MRLEDIYLIHIDGDILFSGTKEECEKHKEKQTFRTDCWKINDIKGYGDACYESGYDTGFEIGAGVGF